MPRRARPPAESAAYSVVERIDAAGRGGEATDTVPSGFGSLDRLLGGGFRRRDLVILAGDVASGKSAFALGVAVRTARLGIPTVVFSGEMTEERLVERSIALEARASIDEMRSGRLADPVRSAVGAAAVRLRDLPLLYRPLFGNSFTEITDGLKTVPRRGLAIIDPLQMVEPPRPGPTDEETHALAARALKGIALEEDLAVLAVTRLAHDPAGRSDPRPSLEDLGGRGAVKQHADVVLGLYREEMYRPGGGMEGATELIVAKNRNGPTGFLDLYFYRKWLRFEDMLDK